MNAKSILREAAAALKFNRQRSILTMVSLAWGVSCFVILYSYGEGFGFALNRAFLAIGNDLILMFGGQTSAQAGGERSGRRIRLELTDVEAIRESVPLVAAIAPETFFGRASVVRGYRTESVSLRGVTAPYGRVRNMTMASGRWISDEDTTQKLRLAVLGGKVAEKLFGEIPPEGEELRINGLSFEVIGVLKTKTQVSNYNTPDNECIFIPYDAMSMFREIR